MGTESSLRSEAKASGWLQSAVTSSSYVPSLILLPVGRHPLTHIIFFIVECGIARAFSALCARYACIRRSAITLCYLCAKFSFCRSLRCWTSPRRKIVYSISHSPSLFDVPWTEAFASEYKLHLPTYTVDNFFRKLSAIWQRYNKK